MYFDRINTIVNHLNLNINNNNNNNTSNQQQPHHMINNNNCKGVYNQMERVAIVSYCRTPMGGFNGSLTTLSATDLASIAIKEALKRCGHTDIVNHIDEVVLGNVLSANIGQAPAQIAATNAGIPNTVPCTTINKVCASGMKAVMIGSQLIQTRTCSVVVAGGFESMSNVPYYMPTNCRNNGLRMGNATLTDGMIKDGLTDPFTGSHMGMAAEKCAVDYHITKQQQDEYAISSYQKAREATRLNLFQDEIVPITIPATKSKPAVTVTSDDEVSNANFERLGSLQPSFQKDGTVTAGNASVISDGASILILMSETKAKEMNIPVIAYINSYADASQEPVNFTTSPSKAIPKALQHANLTIDQVDYFEINEAFSVVALANIKLLNLPIAKVNINGGAVAMGHPLGSSGSRIICTLISILKQKKGKIGVASICNGGGGASAIVIELN